jgi:hypothetical protein
MVLEKRGEFEMRIGGKEEVLRFPMRAAAEIAKRFGVKGFEALFDGIDSWGPDDWAFVLAQGLKRGSRPDATADQLLDELMLDEIAYCKGEFSLFLLRNKVDADRTAKRAQEIANDEGAKGPL